MISLCLNKILMTVAIVIKAKLNVLEAEITGCLKELGYAA